MAIEATITLRVRAEVTAELIDAAGGDLSLAIANTVLRDVKLPPTMQFVERSAVFSGTVPDASPSADERDRPTSHE